MADPNPGSTDADGFFPPTHWSLIRRAQDPNVSSYRASLDALIRKYWNPVYRHIKRHWARDSEEAKDLTQAYFLTFLEKAFLRDVNAAKGSFRSFVRVSLRNFLTNWRRDAHALKRRPVEGLLSLEAIVERGDFASPPAPRTSNPEEEFRDDWKHAVLEAALVRLREKAKAEGKNTFVDLLVRYDIDAPPGESLRYEDVAEQFGLTVYQVTNGLHWARKEFREMVIQEIQEQVTSREDLREEAAILMGLRVDD